MCPIPAAVAPAAGRWPSTTPTCRPARVHSRAAAEPTIPAPTMRTSKRSMSESYPVAEWIIRDEEQLRLAGDPGFTSNGRTDSSVVAILDAALEDGSENPFLSPDMSCSELAFSM